MRCPKCKTELINGEDKKYETLIEHVLNPNMEDYPLRSIFVCPNKHSNSFYDLWGDYYGDGTRIEEKYWHALDSDSRKIEIQIHVKSPWSGIKFKHYVKEVNNLRIDGETDIPNMLCCLIKYFLKTKLNHVILSGRRLVYGKR